MYHNISMENFDYLSKNNLLTTILLFFIFSFIGYLWEILLFLFKKGKFVNRGFLKGPWLPIYGYGMILILILLSKFIAKPFLLFLLIILLCGVVEYTTSFLLETLFNKKWWDYSECFLNINGRVCFVGLMFFGIGGIFCVYYITPFLLVKLSNLNYSFKTILVFLLISVYIVDNYRSIKKPNKGKNISVNVKK